VLLFKLVGFRVKHKSGDQYGNTSCSREEVEDVERKHKVCSSRAHIRPLNLLNLTISPVKEKELVQEAVK